MFDYFCDLSLQTVGGRDDILGKGSGVNEHTEQPWQYTVLQFVGYEHTEQPWQCTVLQFVGYKLAVPEGLATTPLQCPGKRKNKFGDNLNRSAIASLHGHVPASS